MANEKNLTKMGKKRNLSTEEAQRMGRKGGKKSAEKKQEVKKFKKLCDEFLNKQLSQKEFKEHLKELGLDSEDMTNKMAMVIGMWEASISGNTKAFELIQNTIGEKPQETLNLNINKKLEDLIK